jgi:hypothetical protein
MATVTNGTAAIFKIKYDGLGSNGEELGLLRNRYYRAAVWVHTSTTGTPQLVGVLNGTWNSTVQTTSVTATINDSKAVTIGNWKRIYVDIFVPADYTSTGGTNNDLRFYIECTGTGNYAFFDDLMIRPVEASVAGKVYNSTGLISAEINTDNYSTYYIYDDAGRVTEVWADVPGSGKKKIKSASFNFGRGLN